MADPRAAAKTRLRRQRILAGPVGRVLFALSWPISLGLFSVITFNIVDTLYIGRLGPDQLAGIGFCFPVIFCMSAVSIGMANGATSVVSRSLGRGDMARARIRITDTVIYTFLLSFLMVGLMFSIDDIVFRALGAPDNVMPYIHQYMNIWFMGMPLLIMPIVLNGLIRATGDAVFPSGMMVMAAGINAAISPFLVFGLMGAPALGVSGAAWATIIARGILAVFAFRYLWRQGLIDLTGHDFAIFRSSVAEITRFGAPAFLAQIVTPLSNGVAIALMAGSGANAVAAYTVATRIEALFLVPIYAISSGVGPFTGQNIGAGNTSRLQLAEGRALGFSLVWGLIGALLLFTIGGDGAALFSEDREITAMADRFLGFIGLGMWGAGFLYVAIGILNPLGHPNLGMAVSFFRHVILFAAVNVILVTGLGLSPEKVIVMVAPAAYAVAGLAAAVLTLRLVGKAAKGPMDQNATAPLNR